MADSERKPYVNPNIHLIDESLTSWKHFASRPEDNAFHLCHLDHAHTGTAQIETKHKVIYPWAETLHRVFYHAHARFDARAGRHLIRSKGRILSPSHPAAPVHTPVNNIIHHTSLFRVCCKNKNDQTSSLATKAWCMQPCWQVTQMIHWAAVSLWWAPPPKSCNNFHAGMLSRHS